MTGLAFPEVIVVVGQLLILTAAGSGLADGAKRRRSVWELFDEHVTGSLALSG